jgi:hypothetical protein
MISRFIPLTKRVINAEPLAQPYPILRTSVAAPGFPADRIFSGILDTGISLMTNVHTAPAPLPLTALARFPGLWDQIYLIADPRRSRPRSRRPPQVEAAGPVIPTLNLPISGAAACTALWFSARA